jgi:phosphatidate cytidylyltransferase
LFSSTKEKKLKEDELTNGSTLSSTTTKSGFRSKVKDIYHLPRTVYRVYTSYFSQLWKATDTSARTKIANDKVRTAVRQVQLILQNTGEYDEDTFETREAKEKLLKDCDAMLAALGGTDTPMTDTPEKPLTVVVRTTTDHDSSMSTTSTEVELMTQASSVNHTDATATATPPKKHRSIFFGAIMGAAVACWVFSGDYIFTGLFCLMTILGQLEYYRMVMNTGVFPARRISVIGATSMFVTALFVPQLHELCLPMFGLWAMIWKLTMRRKIATIPEIATTFTGMFYLGYVPSFWVRTRAFGANINPTRLYPFTSELRSFLFDKFGFLLPNSYIVFPITEGAVFIFWSWLSLAFSDVGAYFVGRKYGKTKLGTISPAAGATSPNKSVEGVLGGCVTSAILSIVGAWIQKWPYWWITGAIHGINLAFLGLIGDLSASMLKRDAGLKDFGNLLPEHGGILDRVDSFVWTAPYSFLVCTKIIPFLKTFAGQ